MRHAPGRTILKAMTLLCAMLLMPASTAWGAADYDTAMTQAAKQLEAKQHTQARGSVIDALRLAKTPDQRAAVAKMLGQVLTAYAALESHNPQVRLTLTLQAAGAQGLTGDLKTMQGDIEAALDQAKAMPAAERVKAIWDAAVFYVHLRENEVARVLDERKDQLHQAHYSRNVYEARHVAKAPVGVGGWLQSPLLKDKASRESRFHPYPQRGDAYALVADMAADRPLEERENATLGERGTSFHMVYDDAGWHIYIEAQEPDVQEIMMSGGKGGSSLEMFLSPGLEAGVYHQIMIRLGTGEVNFYNWGSPHRGYRHLTQEPGGVKVESVPLDDRWAVVIFIPWHFFHDRLPFVEGNDSTWRFTLVRFGPVRATWGGRVHESGRWGLVQWQPPAAGEQANILRRLIRQAALKFQQTQQQQAAFWSSTHRGDPAFYSQLLEPAIKQYQTLAEEAGDVQQWSPGRVQEVFRETVPAWMEFDYRVDELRSQYLTQQLLAGN